MIAGGGTSDFGKRFYLHLSNMKVRHRPTVVTTYHVEHVNLFRRISYEIIFVIFSACSFIKPKRCRKYANVLVTKADYQSSSEH